MRGITDNTLLRSLHAIDHADRTQLVVAKRARNVRLVVTLYVTGLAFAVFGCVAYWPGGTP